MIFYHQHIIEAVVFNVQVFSSEIVTFYILRLLTKTATSYAHRCLNIPYSLRGMHLRIVYYELHVNFYSSHCVRRLINPISKNILQPKARILYRKKRFLFNAHFELLS